MHFENPATAKLVDPAAVTSWLSSLPRLPTVSDFFNSLCIEQYRRKGSVQTTRGSVEIMRCDVVLYHPRVLTVASQWETVASHRKQIWLLQVPFNVPWLLFYSSSIIVIVVVMAVGMRIVIIIRLSDSGQRDVQTKSRRVLAQLYSNK